MEAGAGLTDDYLRAAARRLRCDIAAVAAVADVESDGAGYLADGRLRVVFEGHVFYRFTQGRFADSHPTLCYPRWTYTHYCKAREPEERSACEWERLTTAMSLERSAALMSAAFGRFQIMGFNFAHCGYTDVESFVRALQNDERAHVESFVEYLLDAGMDEELRSHHWEAFSRRYNGAQYKRNRYEMRLALAYAKHLEPA